MGIENQFDENNEDNKQILKILKGGTVIDKCTNPIWEVKKFNRINTEVDDIHLLRGACVYQFQRTGVKHSTRELYDRTVFYVLFCQEEICFVEYQCQENDGSAGWSDGITGVPTDYVM